MKSTDTSLRPGREVPLRLTSQELDGGREQMVGARLDAGHASLRVLPNVSPFTGPGQIARIFASSRLTTR